MAEIHIHFFQSSLFLSGRLLNRQGGGAATWPRRLSVNFARSGSCAPTWGIFLLLSLEYLHFNIVCFYSNNVGSNPVEFVASRSVWGATCVLLLEVQLLKVQSEGVLLSPQSLCAPVCVIGCTNKEPLWQHSDRQKPCFVLNYSNFPGFSRSTPTEAVNGNSAESRDSLTL